MKQHNNMKNTKKYTYTALKNNTCIATQKTIEFTIIELSNN